MKVELRKSNNTSPSAGANTPNPRGMFDVKTSVVVLVISIEVPFNRADASLSSGSVFWIKKEKRKSHHSG